MSHRTFNRKSSPFVPMRPIVGMAPDLKVTVTIEIEPYTGKMSLTADKIIPLATLADALALLVSQLIKQMAQQQEMLVGSGVPSFMPANSGVDNSAAGAAAGSGPDDGAAVPEEGGADGGQEKH